MTDRTEAIDEIESLRNVLRDENASLGEIKGLAESIKEHAYYVDQVLDKLVGEK